MVEVGAIFLTLAGTTAGKLLNKAAERHVEAFFQGSLGDLAKLGQKKPMVKTMEVAWKLTLDTVLKQVQALGGYEDDDPELKNLAKALLGLLENDHVGAELLRAVLHPEDPEAVDPMVLAAAWTILDGPSLPAAFTWEGVIHTYRARLEKALLQQEGTREVFDSENLAAIRKLLEGVAPKGNAAKYAHTVRLRYRVLDLSALRETTPDKRTVFEVQKVFVPQQIRLDPPPVEIPRDVLLKLGEEGVELPEEEDEELARRLQQAREALAQRPPEPVLEALAEASNRQVVLIGGPGSGKSTLTRFLLLSTLEEPGHGAPDWLKALRGHLPLLLELREFQLAYAAKHCKSFLDYWHHLGETESYHLDRQWLHERLSSGPSLVLFDGLDEIFKIQERKRVMRAIAGFARDYPMARIVVTSRPIGYPEEILRTAGFRHYGIEDLDAERITTFVDGWFRLLFPADAKSRDVRVQRIQEAMGRPSVRLLAGNPMLLTIMAVIAERQALPSERWEFFQYAGDTLSHHWEVNKELEEAVLPEGFGLPEKKELLSRIAFRLQSGKGGLAGNAISENALEKEVSAYLAKRYGLAPGPSDGLARGLIDKLRRRNYILCLRGSAVYGFVHRTLLEFFCARWWVERLQNDPAFSIDDLWEEVFAKHWDEAEWNEVLRLICGMVGERNSRVLLQRLLQGGKPGWKERLDDEAPGHLILALQCLSELRNVREVEEEYVAAIDLLWEAALEVRGLFLSSAFAAQLGEHVLPTVRRGSLPKLAMNRCKDLLGREFQRLESFQMARVAAEILSGWIGGEDTDRAFFRDACAVHPHDAVRSSALERLAQSWPDEATRTLLVQKADQDESAVVRTTALQGLAQSWPDEATRTLLVQKADQDENASVQRTALQRLAQSWPDEATRTLLIQKANQDENDDVRSAALHLLAKSWPDEATRTLLVQRADQDENEYVRSIALQLLAWGKVDRRALLLLSRDLDGVDPFLDPKGPITQEHLERGAKQMNLSVEEVRSILEACEEHLGWNPLLGLGASSQSAESPPVENETR